MENEILEVLKQIQSEQVMTNKRLEKLEEGQIKLEESQMELQKGQMKLEESQMKLQKGQMKLEESQMKLQKGQMKLEESQMKLEEGQNRIEKKLDAIYEQTADLTEFRTETKESIDALGKDIKTVINVTKSNCYDITYLKSAK